MTWYSFPEEAFRREIHPLSDAALAVGLAGTEPLWHVFALCVRGCGSAACSDPAGPGHRGHGLLCSPPAAAGRACWGRRTPWLGGRCISGTRTAGAGGRGLGPEVHSRCYCRFLASYRPRCPIQETSAAGLNTSRARPGQQGAKVGNAVRCRAGTRRAATLRSAAFRDASGRSLAAGGAALLALPRGFLSSSRGSLLAPAKARERGSWARCPVCPRSGAGGFSTFTFQGNRRWLLARGMCANCGIFCESDGVF